jgi:hypothetical protein
VIDVTSKPIEEIASEILAVAGKTASDTFGESAKPDSEALPPAMRAESHES